MTFSELGLSETLLRALADQGYQAPTPIQAQAIPAIRAGQDVLAAAQTGTGKTAAFTLPILQHLAEGMPAGRRTPRALVLTPTRELAAQVADAIATYGRGLPLRSAVIFGGVSQKPQVAALHRGVDIVVATPGRLLDLATQGAISFSVLEMLVLDEADRMLDMGFIHDIRRIIRLLPERRQNLMFSATYSRDIERLARQILREPVQIDVAPRNTAAHTVSHHAVPVARRTKRELLSWLIGSRNWQQVLVFTRTKHGANRLAAQLDSDGLPAQAIHGNKSQNARTRALEAFKAGRLRVLVATDIAARGLDIAQLPHVVNYELPTVPADYVHRIGRTGRAGSAGTAVSLVDSEERNLQRDIERLLGQPIPLLDVSDFSPSAAASAEAEPARSPRSRGSRRPASGSRGRGRRRPGGEGRRRSR